MNFLSVLGHLHSYSFVVQKPIPSNSIFVTPKIKKNDILPMISGSQIAYIPSLLYRDSACYKLVRDLVHWIGKQTSPVPILWMYSILSTILVETALGQEVGCKFHFFRPIPLSCWRLSSHRHHWRLLYLLLLKKIMVLVFEANVENPILST